MIMTCRRQGQMESQAKDQYVTMLELHANETS